MPSRAVAAGDADRARDAAASTSRWRSIALGCTAESATRLTVLRRRRWRPPPAWSCSWFAIWHALDLNATTRIGPLQDELMDLLERNDDPVAVVPGHPPLRINGLPGNSGYGAALRAGAPFREKADAAGARSAHAGRLAPGLAGMTRHGRRRARHRAQDDSRAGS